MVIPLHFKCVEYEGIVLQLMDTCEHVMFLVQMGHEYLICGPVLVFIFPLSVRRAHRASEPPAHVAAVHGRLTKNNCLSEAPLEGMAEVAGERVSPFSKLASLRSLGFAIVTPLAGRCLRTVEVNFIVA